MPNDDLVFRTATADDLERIIEVNLAAFPDQRTGEERRRNFTASRFGNLEDLVLVERGDEIVAQAFLFPLEGWFGGRPVQMGGVASLAVAPEARGQGVATALLRHLHVASDVRGDALTMLYAFRQRFYGRFGYGTTSSRRRLAIDPASVPSSWRALARARVRRPRGDDKDAIRAVHARSAARASGWLTRSETLWDRHFARERRHFLVADSPESKAISGYVAFEVFQGQAHAASVISVDELAADDDVTRQTLLGALAAMRDQIVEIEIEIGADDPLELALLDSDGRHFGTSKVEHDLGAIVGGPMVRIEDVPRAIESRGYAADGAFDVVVHAGEGDSNGGGDELAVSVRVEDGRAEVSAARGTSRLRTSRAALATILYGGLRPSDAVRLGLADADARTLARIDPIVAMVPLTPVDPF
jgi:predicted acetyltransferase